jgi:hypothetical protein
MSLQSRTQSRAGADGPARSVRIQLVSESNRSPALAGVADPFPDHCRCSIMALTAQPLPSHDGKPAPNSPSGHPLAVSRRQMGLLLTPGKASESACSSTPI